jgi:hypothetical protein
MERLQIGLDQISSPYLKILSQDDFFLASGIQACIEFLESHRDHILAWGISLGYREVELNVSYFLLDSWARHFHNNADCPLERIQYFWNNCPYDCAYGVFRTEAYRNMFALQKLVPSEFNIHERIGLTALAAMGKSIWINTPFSIRESRPNSESSATIPLDQLVNMPEHATKIQDMFNALVHLAKMFPAHADLSPQAFAKQAFHAILHWYCETLQRKWLFPNIFSSTWPSFNAPPSFTFAPRQYIDCNMYNSSFFDVLTDIDFRIRTFGLCEQERTEHLNQICERIVALIQNKRHHEAEQLLLDIAKLTPFHNKTANLLQKVYQETRQNSQNVLLSSWLSRMQQAHLAL